MDYLFPPCNLIVLWCPFIPLDAWENSFKYFPNSRLISTLPLQYRCQILSLQWFPHQKIHQLLSFFLMFIYFWERGGERESQGGAEREGNMNLKQASRTVLLPQINFQGVSLPKMVPFLKRLLVNTVFSTSLCMYLEWLSPFFPLCCGRQFFFPKIYQIKWACGPFWWYLLRIHGMNFFQFR